jgi:hypothetical protein
MQKPGSAVTAGAAVGCWFVIVLRPGQTFLVREVRMLGRKAYIFFQKRGAPLAEADLVVPRSDVVS